MFSFGLKFLEMQLFFSILILPHVALKHWNFPDNFDIKGKFMANLAGFYTIRVFTEKCFWTDYNFKSSYNFMQWWGSEMRGDHRRCKMILI